MKMNRQLAFLFCVLFSASITSAQVPLLNSFPESTNVVLLDFDGHLVEGTSWNASGPLACGASTLDAAQIASIFHRVAEDYRPFTINITTDSAKYLAAPPAHRMRVVLTVSSSWYGAAGGVAFINSFSWGDNTPCFVFTALLNNNTKYIAEATSHEIGHTLGLRHQSSYDVVCNKTSEYNAGVGSGEIGWAPIMGVGYYRNMTLWNYGANPFGCTSIQDDLSIITGNENGIDYRTDDHAESLAGATAAPVLANAFTVAGIIEKPGDVDAVTFTTRAAGRFTLDASPYGIASANTGANIDVEIELLNGYGDVLGVFNSAATLNTTIDTTLPAGAYFLRVQGKGNEYAPNYASLGSYTLKGTVAPGNALPLRKLQLKGTAEARKHILQWEVVADEQVESQSLEVSVNGTGFRTLAATDGSVRSYNYGPATASILYYRLKIILDDGQVHYSNTVALRNNVTAKPVLIGNQTTGTLNVSSPAAYNYTIIDRAGRILQQGKLVPGLNRLSPALPGPGIYLIHFNNGVERYTEKFSQP
ncbi:MAG TPA: M57 family metalloprotease [Flavisolibacter sp.]|nr:M57 family metalloprotease [Flavisolibacter sp.]